MNWEILWTIIPYVITLLAGVFASYWLIGKGKIAQIKKAIDVISAAVEDNQISEAEAKAIVAAVREVLGL